jgi:hypothetical protein
MSVPLSLVVSTNRIVGNSRVVALTRIPLRRVVGTRVFKCSEGEDRRIVDHRRGCARLLAITFGQGYDRLRACPDFPSRHVLVTFKCVRLGPFAVSTTIEKHRIRLCEPLTVFHSTYFFFFFVVIEIISFQNVLV